MPSKRAITGMDPVDGAYASVPAIVTEFVRFSLLYTPCCCTLLCWVNPRMPNYCPECGTQFPGGLHKEHPEAIVFRDDEAKLMHKRIP